MQYLLTIKNFRSIKSTSITLNSGLNILIGPNGSGKTNALAALKFLSDVLVHGTALAMGKAGGSPRNFYRGTKEFEFRVEGEYGECNYKRKKKKFYFSWVLAISRGANDQIAYIAKEIFIVKSSEGAHYVYSQITSLITVSSAITSGRYTRSATNGFLL